LTGHKCLNKRVNLTEPEGKKYKNKQTERNSEKRKREWGTAPTCVKHLRTRKQDGIQVKNDWKGFLGIKNKERGDLKRPEIFDGRNSLVQKAIYKESQSSLKLRR